MLIEPSQKTLKTRLRKKIRQKRASIGPEQRAQWDTQINRHLEDYAGRNVPGVVAAYMAFDGEPDLAPALAWLDSKGATLALPVVQDAPGKAIITFRRWSPDEDLVPNRFGIAEPARPGDIIATDIDLVLMPLVGWDRAGGRLGMGASFYDRLFQPFAELKRPIRMGVGYELQRVHRVPGDPWDIRLHCILTENGWFTCEE